MFTDLDEIADIFGALDGRDRCEARIDEWCHWRAHYDPIVKRAWRLANIEKVRAKKREWRKSNREKDRAAKQRYADKYREHIRIVWRRNAAAYRARKRAAKG